ncbi:hypothetical protein [Candidatus Protochlamydia phocaeensis]|uniref:hypothetical protein n=1 Tax=Candidatus Protochlamydia phocaeensis TaxID=1414722 RepID=UPI0008399C6B|nr:hypothetical protein [Candidatus Protochlamydia phocaeensis]
MVDRARTKDESFIIRLYEEASKLPDIEDPLDRYVIGTAVGLQKNAVDTICNLLAKANFIKKHGNVDISITENGIKLVKSVTER